MLEHRHRRVVQRPARRPLETWPSGANYVITKFKLRENAVCAWCNVKNVLLTVDGAPDGLGGAEDLLHDPGEVPGHGPGPHDARRRDDVVHGDVARVLDVLDLLAVPRGLLERLDDEGGGGGHHADFGLPVLDGELDGDLEALPVLGGLGDVVADLLGGEAERANLGGQGGGGRDLASDGTELHDLNRANNKLNT